MFATLIVIALIALLFVVSAWLLIGVLAKPRYRRGDVRTLDSGHHEFPVFGIANYEEAEEFIVYVMQTFACQIIDHDLETDETVWRLGNPMEWVSVFFDDHAGTRVRSMDAARRGLFGRLLSKIKV